MTLRILFVYLIRCLELALVAAGPPGAWLPSLIFLDFPKAMSGSSLINFTPATDPSDLWKDGQLQSQPEELEPILDGAAARAFYEALIEDESSTPETQRAQPGPARKRKKRRMTRETAAGAAGGHGQRRSLDAKDKTIQQILRAAQEGDLSRVETRVTGVWRSQGGWFPLGRHGGTGPYAPNTWVDWEGPDPQPHPASPQGPHGQYSIPARPCSGLLGPCGAGADG